MVSGAGQVSADSVCAVARGRREEARVISGRWVR